MPLFAAEHQLKARNGGLFSDLGRCGDTGGKHHKDRYHGQQRRHQQHDIARAHFLFCHLTFVLLS